MNDRKAENSIAHFQMLLAGINRPTWIFLKKFVVNTFAHFNCSKQTLPLQTEVVLTSSVENLNRSKQRGSFPYTAALKVS